ncbi:MAG TPA: acylphosphatase [Terriglobia bacterium]|nr:acylphosphatase [Terriglobia bacterium]
MKVAANIIVTGLVQGVGFRYFVHRRASGFGIKGHVRNLYNGDVEIEVEGEQDAVESLIQEVRVGPRSAHVTDVKVIWKDPRGCFSGFHIG